MKAVLLLTGLVLASIHLAEAQQPTKIARIGLLTGGGLSAESSNAFLQGLRDFGYIEGKNILIEWRVAAGKRDRVPALTAELVRLNVDAIVTRSATDTRQGDRRLQIPIVMTNDGDPVGNGFIDSLAKPGGNITGLPTVFPRRSAESGWSF
jgi:putative tryptophan/tyrosine transport system substrate-binding protein